jgi:hypothetical protein
VLDDLVLQSIFLVAASDFVIGFMASNSAQALAFPPVIWLAAA